MENILETPGINNPGYKFLKVLTILTFIGCAYIGINSLRAYFGAEDMMKDMQKGMAKMEDAGNTGFFYESMQDAMKAMEIRLQHNTLFFILDMVSIALCLYGAIIMRQLKKTGFYLYLVGEIMPFVVTLILIGKIALGFMFIIGLVVPLAFIIMYLTQLKKLN